MANYNVNLPKTSFPMKADLANREPNLLKYWQQIGLNQKFATPENAAHKFVLHDGPPYANGSIHIGHALNKILKDIVNKGKVLDGYAVTYVPGWDCHGLPIELNVEKKIGKVDGGVTADEFIAKCREYATSQINAQRQDFERLGVIGDWEHNYQTMNFVQEANTIRALAKIIDNGYLERGFKPVHWCAACGSALAEAEVEYQDKTSPAIDVRFRAVNPDFFKVAKVSIPIWTTTPWTLPANEAVALHPTLEYVLVHCPSFNEHLIIAKALLPNVMQRYGIDNYQIVACYSGQELEGQRLYHPFLDDKTVPVILGDHVTTDTGTGAVHTAPAHGQDDFRIGQKYNLPVVNPVDSKGRFIAKTPYFAGEKVFDANEHVIEILNKHHNLIVMAKIQHSYPHCWRHKTPLIFRATQQWFISMDKIAGCGKSLREQALAAIKQVTWFPAQGEDRIQDMIVQRPDWCISRQRLWGTPITLFTHKETGELHPETQHLIAIITNEIEKSGVIYWHKLDAETFLKIHAPNAIAEDYEKVTDTLDVWFDSGVTHYCVLQKRDNLQFPADLYLEGSDQYRGWFQSSLLTAVAIDGQAPYRQVFTHGFAVDAHGHKMSKSLGNVVDPKKVINTLGADIIRLWVASSYVHAELAVSDEILQRNVDSYRMLRNTARFLLGNLAGFDPAQDLVAPKQMLALDRWIIAKAMGLQQKFQEHYRNDYQFHTACNYLQTLISQEISGFYFSIIKDRLYTMSEKSIGRRSAQTALLHILEILVRCIAPILSFTAEEIWQELRKLSPDRTDTVFTAGWYQAINSVDFDVTHDVITQNDWENIQQIRDLVYKELEKLRANGQLGSNLEAEVTIYCSGQNYQLLEKLGDELRFVLITSTADLEQLSECPKDAIPTGMPELFLTAKKSAATKCNRCWHYREDVGNHADHPELCGRCHTNLFEAGETRSFA